MAAVFVVQASGTPLGITQQLSLLPVLILGIDRFMSGARALTNLVGNGVATVVVGKWCRQLDETRLRTVLERGQPR